MPVERYGRYGSRRPRNPFSPFGRRGRNYRAPRGGGGSDIEDYFDRWEAEQEEEEERDEGPRRKPIGVGEDYRTPYERDLRGMGARGAEGWSEMGAGHGTMSTRGPRYYADDEWKPGNLRADSVSGIQRAMVEAGILGWGDFTYKLWDEPSAAAFKQVLAASNARGTTWEMTLSEMATSGAQYGATGGAGGGGGEGGGFAGFDENGEPIFEFVPPAMPPIKTTNKDDLRRTIRDTAIKTTGVGWSQKAINELVDAYNWKEVQIQKDLYAEDIARMEREFQGEDVTDDTITEGNMPSAETFFETEARKKDPVGFQANQMVNETIPEFFQMMEGWA